MQCPSCGAETVLGDVFCGKCGADVRVAATPPPPPPPASQVPRSDQVNPTQQMTPPPPPAQSGGPQPASASPTMPFPAAASVTPPPFPTQPAPSAAKTGLSTGAIIGIVAGSLVGVLLLGAAGFFAFRAFSPRQPVVPVVTSTPVTKPKPVVASEPTPTAPVADAPTPVAPTADPGEYVVVTDAEAKDVVTRFLTLRAAKNIAGSKALCTAKMLAGPDGDFVNDKYWNPDSFKIIKLTPDQMYIHVTTMGAWPSGDEATIFQVYREPESGKVLIDGFLDPADFPELVKP